MAESKRFSIKTLPLFCMPKRNARKAGRVTKENDGEQELSINFPVPIDEMVEYVDYSGEHLRRVRGFSFEGTLIRDASSASDSEQLPAEGRIKTSAFGTVQQGPPSSSAVNKVRRAEGIALKSDRSLGLEAQQALGQLQDLMLDEVPDEVSVEVKVTAGLQSAAPGNDSARGGATARSSVSLGASQSATESHRGSADPSDVLTLKRTIRRLTAELSRLLTAPRADGKSADEVDSDKLLPGKGPLPPWLCDPRVFAPLMSAYERQLADTKKAAGDTDAVDGRLLDVEARVLDVVRENERLRVKLREAAVAEPAHQTEWDSFTEQARLVLEENQLLIEQLGVQQAKARLAQREYLEEAAKLKCRIEELEAENAQVRAEFDGLHGKLQEVKQKYHAAAMERETGEMQTVDRMRSLSKELLDTREEFVRANEELLRQLQKSEREKVKLTQSLTDAITERDTLKIEVLELKSAVQLKHKELVQLQKSSKKRDSLQDCLESVVNAATNIQEEFDICKEKLESQETELTQLISYLVNELKFHDKNDGREFDEDSLTKIPTLTAKFEFLVKRFAALLKRNEDKREELVKQIRYLQALIREKSNQMQALEAEHRAVTVGLETVWQAAVSS